VIPVFTSATPVAVFRGQRHQASLLGHLQSSGPIQYDTVLAVNETGKDHYCLIVTLEADGPGRSFVLGVYNTLGRHTIADVGGTRPERSNFLTFAKFIVEKSLKDQFEVYTPSRAKVTVEEKAFREFYPDPAQRQKLHYCFAHVWLPDYARQDPARFFGYFQRGEANPNRFIRSRFQIMEYEMGLTPPPLPSGQWATHRLMTDLQLWVCAPPAWASPDLQLPAGGLPAGVTGLAVVQMPAPEVMTHAYFVAVIALSDPLFTDSTKITAARAFTLEKRQGVEGAGVLCEWLHPGTKDRIHWKYPSLVAVDRHAFAAAVLASLREGEAKAAESPDLGRQ
jgi:hypothetical protein